MQQFYRLNDNPRSTSTLDYIARLYAQRLPNEIIPIGGDVAGGKICLGVSGASLGRVYYWDPGMDFEDTSLGSFENIEVIASTFENFIMTLEAG